MPRSQLCTIRS